MQRIPTQPAGPKAFRLYSLVRDIYRRDIGERAFIVYTALTYYVDPKTLQGTIPIKLLAQTAQCPPTTVRRYLHRLFQQGLITITPQWDAFGCVHKANLYALRALSLKARPPLHAPLATVTPPKRRRPTPRLTLLRCPTPPRPSGDISAQRP